VLGEFDLIDRLRERIAAAGASRNDLLILGSGDDAAVTVPGGATATSVDAIVDGVHFRRSTHKPADIGAKAMATAVSDLAAMGAEPGEAYVQLGLPEDIELAELEGIADGLGEAAAEEGITVAGGDVVGSPVLFLALTVVGHAEAPEALVTRGGAEPGDLIVITGPVGGAAAGLLLLDRPELARGLDEPIAQGLRRRQLRPRALPAAGRALAEAGARAMIDVSDGLEADAGHIARASRVRIEIDLGADRIQAGVAEVASAAGEDALDLAAGGEDYELLAAIPAGQADVALEALRETGCDPALVGRVADGEGVVLRGPTGRESSGSGFDQVRSRAPRGPT
jgi:thiamine-monophosphate kinase